MSTRHDAPSQRRQSHEDTKMWSSRPLPSSSFAPIDPSVPARHSSLHKYPQNIFPSKNENNHLDSDLEVPYAFSHELSAFYFTEADALENHKLNIWAKPPCLNCEIAGDTYARQCDRYARQEDSEGQIQCCSRCKRKGDNWSCIEQLEIRADGNYGRVLRHPVDRKDSTATVNSVGSTDSKDSFTLDNVDYITVDFNQWCGEEQDLRRKGLVWWSPINLEYGDAVRKKDIVEQWLRRDTQPELRFAQLKSGEVTWKQLKTALPQWATPTEPNDSGKVSWENQQALEERMALCKQINQVLVAEWNEEEDLKRETEQVEDDARTKCLQPDDDSSVVVLEREKFYWSERIRSERRQQYHKESTEVGQDVAGLSQKAWEAKESDVVLLACRFLERKRHWMQ